MGYFRFIIAAGLLTGVCLADEVADSAVKILKQNCTGCHGASLKMSKLDLRSRESILAGGERGPAVEPGKAESSRLYRFVAGIEKPSMPPGKTLAPEQVEILRHWIDAGASMPVVKEASDEVEAALAKMEERPITDQERKYWAF